MLKQLKNWIIQWLWIVLVLWLVWVSYAAYVNITTVNSNEPLTSSLMNNLINNQKDIQSQLIWVWQTWQSVKANRSSWVTYTNNTWKPIFLSVYSDNWWNWAYIQLEIDWILLQRYDLPNLTGTEYMSVFWIIPNGSTYKVSVTGNITNWAELR